MDKVYDVLNEASDCPLVLTCEHASAAVPAEYHNLGLPQAEFDRHIARDKGAKEVTEILARKLGCFAVLGGYSRLLIDLNRRPGEAELIVTESDKTVVPENQALTEAERQKRIDTYYTPYYEAVARQIRRLAAKGTKPVIFSVHSYTPQLKGGVYRPWQAGILYHNPTKLASYLYEGLKAAQDKNIGENVPYDLRKYNTGTVIACGEDKGFDYALIEIRDDEFDNLASGAEDWGGRLGVLLQNYIGVSKR